MVTTVTHHTLEHLDTFAWGKEIYSTLTVLAESSISSRDFMPQFESIVKNAFLESHVV